jgi:hypothetical protein
MAAIHPQMQGSQDPYRLPPPPGAYQRPPDMYGQPPQLVYQAAAPRQRTAIACRYCRRRKVSRVVSSFLPFQTFCIHLRRWVVNVTVTLDSLLRFRKLPGWTLQQLYSLQSGVHVHARLFPSSGFRSSPCGLSPFAQSGSGPGAFRFSW